MQVQGFFVWMRVTDDMPPTETAQEIKTSIGFGQPQITPVFVFPEETPAHHTTFKSHDGYVAHSHEVRPDHSGVPKEWGDNV